MRVPLTVAAAVLALSGCTWVHMAPGANAVRVLSAGAPPVGCEKRGDVAVSVKDRVAFYERNELTGEYEAISLDMAKV